MIDEKKLIEELNRQKYILTFEDSNPIDEGFNCGIDKAIQLVESQPKVGEWIPVEERLPKQDKLLQDYLVTFEYYRYGEYDCMYKTIGIGTFSKVSHEFTFINGQTGWRDLKVLSWQPLPEPWKGETE